LRSFCTALALECALPVETVVVVCLWTLMRATVPGARLCAAGEEIPVGSGVDSLVLIHQDTKELETLLDRILEPIMNAQAGLVEASERLDKNKLALREAQLKRTAQMVSRERFPDPTHLEYLRAELDVIQAQRQPLLMLKDPSAHQLEDSLPHCLDNAPGVVLTDARSSTEILDYLAKLQPEESCGVSESARGVSSGPNHHSGATTAMISCPGSQLAVLCCCDAQFIDEVINRCSWMVHNSFFLNFGSALVETTQSTTADIEPWHALVRQAIALRLSRAHPVWQLSPKAATRLHSGAAALAAPAGGLFPYSPMAVTGMCGRLALALHACLHAPGTNLPHETVECALALLQWLMQERGSVLQASLAAVQARQESAAEAIMLQKIRSRGGRLRRRELFRMYLQQRKEIQGPVLDRLIRKQAVFFDKAGFVSLTERLDQATLTQRITIKTY
jgi:hypothetical protein